MPSPLTSLVNDKASLAACRYVPISQGAQLRIRGTYRGLLRSLKSVRFSYLDGHRSDGTPWLIVKTTHAITGDNGFSTALELEAQYFQRVTTLVYTVSASFLYGSLVPAAGAQRQFP